VHSYYHLLPRVCCYCSVGDLPMLVCFLVFHRLARKYLALLVDVVSGFKSFRSGSPVMAL
jgi:hypothetical protein